MEVVVSALAREYARRGHKVTVFTKHPRKGKKPLPPLPYEVVHYARTQSSIWLLGAVKRSLKDLCRGHRFDVVHAHMAYPTGYVAVKTLQQMTIPVVITSHKGDIVPDSRFRRRFIPRRRMTWALREAAAATGVSDELTRIIEELTQSKAKTRTIPNGVDFSDAPGQAPKELAKYAQAPFVLTLGRLHRHKGLDVLLDAWALLRDRGVQLPRLLIAGDGRVMEELQTRLERLNLSDSAALVGTQTGDAKRWLLANCRFFLQPSRVEGMPLTLLEAMSFGRAVLGTNIGGIRELLTDGHNGLLVEPENPDELADAIEKMLAGSDLDAMGQNGRKLAEKYSWGSIAEEYLALYRSVLR
jgi:glycosyltransferase involved in cell wall biosynthesis